MGARWLHDLPQALAGIPDVAWYPGWDELYANVEYETLTGLDVGWQAATATEPAPRVSEDTPRLAARP